MGEPKALKYRAFVSYSHADTIWAKWLQRGLETFKVDKDLAGRETARGVIPDALRPIFRDREDFTAGEALPEQTRAALDASNALIVVCSPDSATSSYVNEELRLFKWRHPDRPIIPVIVGGKPDDPERECFPSALKFKVDGKGHVSKKRLEVLAADAREEGDGKDLALAKVVAGLLGLPSDEVFRRAERERRVAARRRRRVQALVIVLTVLLAAAGLAWWKQDILRDRYYWATVMGPSLLTPGQESDLRPKDEFKECRKGCPAMVVVPAGTFLMGSPQREGPPLSITEDWEHPQHAVEILNPFGVSKFEITYDDWNVCVAYGECNPRVSNSGWGYGRQPVATVEWDDAKHYVAWLSRMTGKDYRLLSEAEWEYSARAGARTAYSWGDEVGTGNANCKGCGGKEPTTMDNASTPVGSFPPNAFGLYDMHGNVSEWVEDTLQYDYEGAPSDGSAWVETSKLRLARVVRGGDWGDDPIAIRSAARSSAQPEVSHIGFGFRIARTLATKPTASRDSGARTFGSEIGPEASLNLAGIYRLSATGHDGNKHTGMLAITYSGTSFGLSRWIKGQVSYGAGRLTDEKLTVAWGTTGPAVYVLRAKGVLEGQWADGVVAETGEPLALASQKSAPSPEGTYKVDGRNSDGGHYAGVVTISKQANHYYFHWEIGDDDYQGEGILKRNVLTVDYGGATPVVYALDEAGQLTGLWNSGKAQETLTPIRDK